MTAPFPLAYLPDSFEFVSVIAVLTLALMLIFVGSRLIQWLSFVVVGLVTASAGTMLGGYFLGPLGALVGFAGGFVIGAVSTVVYLPVSMGMALGFVGYAIAQTFVSIAFVPPLVWLVGFAYGFLLTDLLIPALSSAVGGGLLFEAGLTIGLPPAEMFLFALAMSAAGVATQTILARKAHDLFGRPRVQYRSRRARN